MKQKYLLALSGVIVIVAVLTLAFIRVRWFSTVCFVHKRASAITLCLV